MALSGPQLQWSLDQSAGSFLSVGRRFIEAATSDNVQILALMTCESFGATLPVSTITRFKVETLARRNACYTVTFLKAQIGYKAGDSADALSQSDGGLRFLCLAAVLCTFGLGFTSAAQALDRMIRSNSGAEQKCPTMLQLRDLLKALSPKLSDSGFTTDVLGWIQLYAPDRQVRSQWHDNGRTSFITPGYDELSSLIEAIQRCHRIGDSDTKAVIKADSQYIPWTIAVVKWLTDIPPPVRRLDGTTLLSSTNDTISIEEDEVRGRYLISLLTRVESVDHIISTKGNTGPGIGMYNWLGGFLNVQSWLSTRLDHLDIESDLAYRILATVINILPDAILLCENIHPPAIAFGDSNFRQTLPQPFPAARLREEALVQMFPRQVPESSSSLDDIIREVCQKCLHGCICNLQGQNNRHDPQEVDSEQHLNQQQDLQGDGSHHENFQQDDISVTSTSSSLNPNPQCFKTRIGSIIADILALLLFATAGNDDPYPKLSFPDFRIDGLGNIDSDSTQDITVYAYDKHGYQTRVSASVASIPRFYDGSDQYLIAQTRFNWEILIVHGWWPILTGQWLYLSCPSKAIFNHVGRMIGHDKDPADHEAQWGDPIVWSRYGRVVYPLILDARVPFQEGFMRLVMRPGSLWWNDQAFDGINSKDTSQLHPLENHVRENLSWRHEISGRKLRESFEPSRKIEQQLACYVGVGTDINILIMQITCPSLMEGVPVNAWDLLYGLGQTVFSQKCTHNPRTPVNKAAASDFTIITQQGETQPILVLPGDKYLLCDLNGKASSQLIQLAAAQEPCLLFSKGCLNCALTFAKKYRIKMVVC